MNYNRNFNYNAHGNDFYFQNNRRNNVDNRIHNDNGNGQSGDYYEAVSDDDDECFGENKLGVERAHRLMPGNNQVQTDQFSSIDLDFDQLPFVPKFSSEIRNTVEAAKNSEGDDSTKTPIVGDWGPHTSKSKPVKNSSQSQPANCPYFPDQSETIIKPLAQANESKSITVSGHDSMLKSEIENSQTTAVTENVHSSIIIQPSSFSQTNNPVSSNTNSIQSSENYAKLESNLLPPLSNLPSASTATIPAGNELVKVNDNNTNVNASTSSSWADENGDPIQGAFDSFNEASTASNSCVNIVNNTKVEYVFHVKEKKNGPGSAGNGSNSVVGSASVSDICADGGISQGTVISSLVNVLSSNNSDSTPLTSQNLNFVDIQDNSGFSDKISDEYDQKRLYEASKNKQELCNLQVENENTASTSASASAIIAVDDSKDALQKKKTEMFAFRRNNFINQPIPCEAFGDMPVAENEQGKSSADKVLESQALNELLREVKQGAERARNYGALAWQKQPIPVVNKRFLKNTLVSTLRQPYKPPTRGGRFQPGLQNNRHKRDDGDNSDSSSSSGSSRSSRSSSRRYSRSSSSSGSYSSSSRSSRGSRSRSRSRRHRHRSKKGKQPFPGGGGPPPPNAYYDWAAAAYGYPWYDPGAAAAMYYGMGDGGGGSGYPQMYSNDPQFWAAYRDFYGMGGGGDGGGGRGGFIGGRGFNPRGAGSRGGWGGGRGRGGGGMMDCDGRWGSRERYSDEERRSISRSRSKSRSRSVSPGSQRKRTKRSKSFENSPSSSSTKGKKRRRSRSLERHADEDKGSGRHRSGSVKSGDTIQDGEKQDGSKRKSKSTSGKKMKSESKKTDHTADIKEGEENDDKGDDMKKKKKKHKKTKKHKKSKISSTEDNGEKGKDDSLKADEGQKKVKEKSNDDSENKKEEIEVGEKSSEKDDNTTGVKKEKKTKSKKKDGHSTKKKLKKCSKGGVNVKEKKGKTQIKDGDSAVDKRSAKLDAKSDEEIRKSETETTSSTDNMKEGEDRNKEHGGVVKEKDIENNASFEKRGKDEKCEEINKDHVGSVKEKSREKNEGYRIRSKEERYEDRYREHGGVEKEKGREKNESCRIRSREEYCSDRSRVREKRYDERTRHSNIDSKRSRDGEKIVHENKGGTDTSSSRRGGKIEEIERRLQERKANQRRQREEEQKSFGGGDADAENMAKRVKNSGAEGSEDNKGDTFVGGRKGESSIPDKEKLGSDVKICESSGKHKTSKEDEGKQKKKKKIVKKKVKTKLKSESRDCDMGGEGVVSGLDTSHKDVSESEQIMSQCDGAMNVKKKKKTKVLKRKSEGGGDREEEMANKTKAKKKKVIKDTSTTETPAKDSLDLEATTPSVSETVSSHTKEMSDKQVSID